MDLCNHTMNGIFNPVELEPEIETRPTEHFRSDIGYSDALIQRLHRQIRYCVDEKRWLVFHHETGWLRDEVGAVNALVADFARQQYDDALLKARDIAPETGRTLIKVMASLGDQRRIRPALELAACDPRIVVRSTDLDSEANLVGTPNGCVNLRDGSFHPHSPDRLVTRRLGCNFVDGAESPTWERFLARVQPDPAMRGFLQRLAGYCLHGAIREHILPFHFGTGANGKGTFLEHGLLKLLGNYGAKITDALVYANERSPQPFLEIAGLLGKRFALGEENAEGGRLNEATLKAATGGDKLKGRYHYSDFVEFWPSAKIHLVGNHRPRIVGIDDGIWRRFLLVDWAVQVPPEERDATLKDRIADEMPGVLNWAIAGAKDWLANGLRPPESCLVSTRAFRDSSDALSEFIRETFQQDDTKHTTKADAFRAYKAWADESGLRHPMSKRALGVQLVHRGWQEAVVGHGNQGVWLGWRLKPSID